MFFRYVEYCDLDSRNSKDALPCTILFTVKSDGTNVLYRFGIQRIGSSSDDDVTDYVIANSSNAIFGEQSALLNSANIKYTFQST